MGNLNCVTQRVARHMNRKKPIEMVNRSQLSRYFCFSNSQLKTSGMFFYSTYCRDTVPNGSDAHAWPQMYLQGVGKIFWKTTTMLLLHSFSTMWCYCAEGSDNIWSSYWFNRFLTWPPSTFLIRFSDNLVLAHTFSKFFLWFSVLLLYFFIETLLCSVGYKTYNRVKML